MVLIMSLPIFIWEKIVVYLLYEHYDNLVKANHQFEQIVPELIYRDEFHRRIDGSNVVVKWKSLVDPISINTPNHIKKSFWKYAMEDTNHLVCREISDIFSSIAGYNSMRKDKAVHIYYKVFCTTNGYYNQSVASFFRGKCSIDVIGLGEDNNKYIRWSFYQDECGMQSVSDMCIFGIESFTMNNIRLENMSLIINNTKSYTEKDTTIVIFNNCIFEDSTISIKNVGKISINNSNINIDNIDVS